MHGQNGNHRLQVSPASYGKIGLGELFEMREECLREFGFTDVYKYTLPPSPSPLLACNKLVKHSLVI